MTIICYMNINLCPKMANLVIYGFSYSFRQNFVGLGRKMECVVGVFIFIFSKAFDTVGH